MFEVPKQKSNLKITVPVGAVVVMGIIATTVLAPRLWPATLSAHELKPAPLRLPMRTGKPAPPHVKVVEVKRTGGARKTPFIVAKVFTAPPRVPDGPPRMIVDPPGFGDAPDLPPDTGGPTCTNCIPGLPCPGCTGTDPGVTPPPPPPDVPDLEAAGEAKEGRLLTTRERMELHRTNALGGLSLGIP